MTPGALLFDFDGLILDTESSEFHSVGLIFTEHGLTLERVEWQRIIGTADHPHWTELLEHALGRPLEDRDAVILRHRENHRVSIAAETVRPGVVELLDEAGAAGVPAAVVSSSPAAWVLGHLDRLGLRDRYADVVTREDVGGSTRTKPAPDLYLLAAERLGVAPPGCVVLEDSVNGVAAGRAAGMTVVAVPGPMTADMDFAAADLRVGSLADVDLGVLAALTADART